MTELCDNCYKAGDSWWQSKFYRESKHDPERTIQGPRLNNKKVFKSSGDCGSIS